MKCQLAGTSGGAQRVRRQKDAAVAGVNRDYDKRNGARRDLKDYLMRKKPSFEGLDLRRDDSPMRTARI